MRFNEIIKNSKKIATVDDVVNNIDFIAEIAKEDVLKIAKSKRIYFADFDFTYSDAVEMLRKQLQKSDLKGIRRFLGFENVANAGSWLIERLVNNMKNITTNQKYKLYCAPSFGQLHENIKSNDELEAVLEFMELGRLDKETLKKGLKDVWDDAKYDSDFDFADFEELCSKFKFNAREVVGSDTLAQLKFSKSQVSNKHSQLELLF